MMHACYLAACICLRPLAACVENPGCSTIPDFSILVLSPCVEQAYNKRFSQQHACYETCSPFSPIMRRQKLIVKNRNEAIWAIKTISDGANTAGYRGHAQRPRRRRGLILNIIGAPREERVKKTTRVSSAIPTIIFIWDKFWTLEVHLFWDRGNLIL